MNISCFSIFCPPESFGEKEKSLEGITNSKGEKPKGRSIVMEKSTSQNTKGSPLTFHIKGPLEHAQSLNKNEIHKEPDQSKELIQSSHSAGPSNKSSSKKDLSFIPEFDCVLEPKRNRKPNRPGQKKLSLQIGRAQGEKGSPTHSYQFIGNDGRKAQKSEPESISIEKISRNEGSPREIYSLSPSKIEPRSPGKSRRWSVSKNTSSVLLVINERKPLSESSDESSSSENDFLNPLRLRLPSEDSAELFSQSWSHDKPNSPPNFMAREKPKESIFKVSPPKFCSEKNIEGFMSTNLKNVPINTINKIQVNALVPPESEESSSHAKSCPQKLSSEFK